MPLSFHNLAEHPKPARLTLVARRPLPPLSLFDWISPRSWLKYWHLLSLDAPSVAALWVAFLGWSAGVRLSAFDPLAMFVAVWILYVADRLLDARPLATKPPGMPQAAFPELPEFTFPELEERHRFHHRHRRTLLPCLVAATILLAWLLHRLAPPVLHWYAILASLLAGWLLLVHAGAGPLSATRRSGIMQSETQELETRKSETRVSETLVSKTRRLPKELAVGLFFPAAVVIPTGARAPALCVALVMPALLFAGLCTLNCLFLYAWEHPHDEALKQDRAHSSTRAALARLRPLASCFAAACWTITIFAASADRANAADFANFAGMAGRLTQGRLHLFSSALLLHAAAIPLATALSGTALLLLHALHRRLEPLLLRALADLVLLSPVPLLCLFATPWHHR